MNTIASDSSADALRTAGLVGTVALFAALTLPQTLQGQDMADVDQMTEELVPPALDWNPNDPRIGLATGWDDAGEAIWNLEKLASLTKAQGFFNPEERSDGGFNNTDLAFRGDLLFQGNYNGFQVYDISNPASPELRVSVVCPGGQGDVSVYGDLLVMSSQESRARLDCGVEGVEAPVSDERIKGVRIFDISDIDNPRQVAAVQSCRGSHTHTLLADPDEPENLYIYIQGTSGARPAEELEGCVDDREGTDPNTAYFRIEVVRVPLANPAAAEIVNEPRIFADYETGDIRGLNPGGELMPGAQRGRTTNQCHDITTYPALGLAGGACSGNGILLDITDPANPVRVAEVLDPNFAYWHSATFNNDGSTVLFTDEWGGGSAPRCRGTDPATWGANAIFTRDQNNQMELAGYYKLPVPQSESENCVAHNGSIIPVPGRDIKAQAWYQGGLSVLDFTDPADAFEIAFFDRGPLLDELVTGGYWSTYWYNGRIYGAEISRGIDVFRLTPNEHLSANEIAAAELVMLDEFNAQMQPMFEWPDVPVVARAYLDQLVRADRILTARAQAVDRAVSTVESGSANVAQLNAAAAALEADALAVANLVLGGDAEKLAALADVLRGMAAMER